jgi:hypothetical protein
MRMQIIATRRELFDPCERGQHDDCSAECDAPARDRRVEFDVLDPPPYYHDICVCNCHAEALKERENDAHTYYSTYTIAVDLRVQKPRDR